MTIEQARFLQRVSDEFGNQECDIREQYSGRGMYGRETVGVVVDSVTQLLADVLNFMNTNVCDNSGGGGSSSEWNGGEPPSFESFRIDNMGRSTILY